MSDARVTVMALAVAFGSWFPIALPLWPFAIVATVAFIASWEGVLIASLAFVASTHSAQQWQHLSRPLPRSLSSEAVLLADPVTSDQATRVEVKAQGRHYELWASGNLASQLQTLNASQRVNVVASVRPLSGKRAPALRRKHIAGTIIATNLNTVPTYGIENTLPNGLHRLLEQGALPLSETNAALFTGLIDGDDRRQSEKSVTDFRNSGLAHLTAVSGANVAFVLLLLTPVFKRFALFGRFAGALLTLAVFGALTRWQPSVIRAEAMAAIVLYSSFVGRPISLLRSLGLAATTLLLADPFLVGTVGFGLSVIACVGMALFGSLIERKLPGTPAFQRAIAYSAAAQIAVAPLQFAIFGNVPLVGLVTNAFADPVAGFVMMWGLPAGLLAGMLGGRCASVLQLPTGLMLDWIRLVAHLGAITNNDSTLRWLIFILPVLALVSWSSRCAFVRATMSQLASTLSCRE